MDSELILEIRKGARCLESRRIAMGDRILLGRKEDADIRLPSEAVSRQHAYLTATDNGLLLEDVSLNGVQGNGQDGFVAFGTSFSIGPYQLVCRSTAPVPRLVDPGQLRRMVLSSLVEHLHYSALRETDQALRPRVETTLDRLLYERGVTREEERRALVAELTDEALGLGPLEKLLGDPEISEIMVVSPDSVYVEKRGVLEHTGLRFSSEESVRTIIERIVTPLGRRIDEASPMVDARLSDGSRVNAVIPPLALNGPCITIRKFSPTPLTMSNLVKMGSLCEQMAEFLEDAVRSRQNIVISGGTGSGKTTLLNVLSGSIPPGERIVTIEDAAELRLVQPHVVRLESRPANAEGKGRISIRDLVRNSLRMRPDRIVVGECRGAEALDMLQAMNTGHDGSLTTTHANSPFEAVSRLETLCLMAGLDLPSRAVREQIAGAVDLIVQQSRFADGSRRIVSLTEVCGVEDGRVVLHEVYRYDRHSAAMGKNGYMPTGWIPRFQRVRQEV